MSLGIVYVISPVVQTLVANNLSCSTGIFAIFRTALLSRLKSSDTTCKSRNRLWIERLFLGLANLARFLRGAEYLDLVSLTVDLETPEF